MIDQTTHHSEVGSAVIQLYCCLFLLTFSKKSLQDTGG